MHSRRLALALVCAGIAAIGAPSVSAQGVRDLLLPLETDPPGLSVPQIREVIAAHHQEMGRCIRTGIPRGIAEVTITIQMTIDESGVVRSVRVRGEHDALSECLERRMKNWRFPASDATVRPLFPLSFRVR